MKISCSTNLLASAGAENLNQAIDIAAELGFDGINIDATNTDFFSVDNFSFLNSAKIVRYAIKNKIEIHSLSVDSLNSNKTKNEIKRLNKTVSVAHALACPLVTFSTSLLDEKENIINQYKKNIEIIKKTSKLAEDFDICFAVEAAVNTVTDDFPKLLQLFVDVDEHNFGVVLNSLSFNKINEKQAENDIDLIDESLLLVKITGEEETIAMNNILNKLSERGDSLYICDCKYTTAENLKKELLNFIKFIKSIKSKK
ncbi:MAG: hypothetical protein DRI44_03665 [Chlamydiae bacterium]|nr:MAG: hypothetical protein DRI44_03665 [Chlamydiota bacterium]